MPVVDDANDPVRLTAHDARTEYDRFGDLLAALSPAEWVRPTVCVPWDVRQLVAHVLGAVEANASPPEMIRQLRRGRRGTAIDVDAVSAVQVERRRHLEPAELLDRYRAAVPAAVAWRTRWSRLAGAAPIPVGAPVHEVWRLRHLMGTIYTRDVWMHRDDICQAVGREMRLTPAHDGRIVAEVVADWAGRHGRPFRLVLGDPAGGTFAHGAGGADLAFDAVEFCRLLSGRGTGAAPLATPVPF